MQTKLPAVIFVFLVSFFSSIPVNAQQDTANQQQRITSQLRSEIAFLNSELTTLRIQLSNLNMKVSSPGRDYVSVGLVLFLCGAFCALWAQDSGRNPWIWFLLGALFPVIMVVVLLMKNSGDIRRDER